MQTYRTSRPHFAVIAAAALCLVTAQAASALGGGNVLPPKARPHGYSLTEMARRVAQFTTSSNDPAYEPITPFQILYVDWSQAVVTFPDDGGLVATGGNSFTVRPGTPFYVPLGGADNSTPVLGTFPPTPVPGTLPVTPNPAVSYFFASAGLGAHDFQITVDGKTTPIGAAYLVGPVATDPLLDFDPATGTAGDSIITLGVFLSPMSVGLHTVTISGEYSGDLILGGYGLSYQHLTFTYTVRVSPHASPSRGNG